MNFRLSKSILRLIFILLTGLRISNCSQQIQVRKEILKGVKIIMMFYDVKSRQKVDVPENDLMKTKYTRTTKNGSTQTRYAVRGNYQGRKLTKFVSEETWNSLDAPME